MIHIAKPDAELLEALATAGVLDAQTAEELKPTRKGCHKSTPKEPKEPEEPRSKPPKEPRSKPARCQHATRAPSPQPIKPAGPLPTFPLDMDDLLSVMPILWIIIGIGLIVGLAIAP